MTTSTATRIGDMLKAAVHQRLVFAESCTGGMAAALMTQVPGISKYFCGSAVTYRAATKTAWLGVPHNIIEVHTAESQQTTDAMAIQVLNKTPEATIACAITGHLGPGTSADVDGTVFVSIAVRSSDTCKTIADAQFELKTITRQERQLEAAECLLKTLEDELQRIGR
jgi:nicotinamide-nucleotide amidase